MTSVSNLASKALRVAIAIAGLMVLLGANMAAATDDPGLAKRFEDLSKNGNSTCSAKFTDSIGTMPAMARIKDSCCSPMELKRYTEQTQGLTKYRDIVIIPQDPYDIPAATARQAASYYDLKLSGDEQKAYDDAMANSNEKGPCCCQCWRWKVYGGLAKYLIHEHGFTGKQIVDVWNLSDGCGGDG